MSLTNSSSDRKCLLGGWADGSVSKVLTRQAQGPEFNHRTRLEKEKGRKSVPCLQLWHWEQRQGDFCGLLASQAS